MVINSAVWSTRPGEMTIGFMGPEKLLYSLLEMAIRSNIGNVLGKMK